MRTIEALAAIRQLFADRDGAFSRFRPESELNARQQHGRPRPPSYPPRSRPCSPRALAIAADTDGLVDPTVGGALEALGYARDFALIGDDPAPADRRGRRPDGEWSSSPGACSGCRQAARST